MVLITTVEMFFLIINRTLKMTASIIEDEISRTCH